MVEIHAERSKNEQTYCGRKFSWHDNLIRLGKSYHAVNKTSVMHPLLTVADPMISCKVDLFAKYLGSSGFPAHLS